MSKIRRLHAEHVVAGASSDANQALPSVRNSERSTSRPDVHGADNTATVSGERAPPTPAHILPVSQDDQPPPKSGCEHALKRAPSELGAVKRTPAEIRAILRESNHTSTAAAC